MHLNINNSKARKLFHSQNKKSRANDFRVPDEEVHVHRSVVYRLGSNNDRKKRLLILTNEELLVALDGRDLIIDKIPLVIDTQCIAWSFY